MPSVTDKPFMLSVVMLNAFLLSVVAPFFKVEKILTDASVVVRAGNRKLAGVKVMKPFFCVSHDGTM